MLREISEGQRRPKRRSDLRLVPTAALTASAVALIVFVLQFPTAAMWAAVVALVLSVLGLFTLAMEAMDLRRELYDADQKNAALEAECDEHAAVSASLAQQLAESQIAGGVVLPLPGLLRRQSPVPDATKSGGQLVRHTARELRIIPPQRTDSWLEEVMDEQARLGEDGAS